MQVVYICSALLLILSVGVSGWNTIALGQKQDNDAQAFQLPVPTPTRHIPNNEFADSTVLDDVLSDVSTAGDRDGNKSIETAGAGASV